MIVLSPLLEVGALRLSDIKLLPPGHIALRKLSGQIDRIHAKKEKE